MDDQTKRKIVQEMLAVDVLSESIGALRATADPDSVSTLLALIEERERAIRRIRTMLGV